MPTLDEVREYLKQKEFEKFLEEYEAEEVESCDTCIHRNNCHISGCEGWDNEEA